MKQRYLVLIVLLFFGLANSIAFAQQKTVSGIVTDSKGNALPGANVIVKGKSSGTVADIAGRYILSVPDGSGTLVFSMIGYASKEVELGNQSEVDIALSEDVHQLAEVVVTALSIERNIKAVQSSVTQISGDNFTEARENSIANQLEGRVAGVNVTKIASGPAGSSRVVIRGAKTLGFGGNFNQPLYVVDGIPMDNSNWGQSGVWGGPDQGDGMNSINPDDVESITVLKGAASAALYGSRAANGVILITTKKGTARKGIGIEFNSNLVAENVINYTDFQKSNGAGGYVGTTLTNRVATKASVADGATTTPDWSTAFNSGWNSQGWGPRFDGTDVIQPDGVVRPYSYAGDNWKRFYQTGITATNSIALSGGSKTQSFRFSFANLKNNGVVPNSGFTRDNFSLASNSKFGKRVTLVSKVMYSYEEAKNRPLISDSPGNAVQAFYAIPGDQNVELYKQGPKLGAVPTGMVTPDGKGVGEELQATSNYYLQNPYWAAYQFINSDVRDRLIASGQLRYDITSFLYVQAKTGMDWYTRRGTYLTPQGTGYLRGGTIVETEARIREINLEYIAGFNKALGKINVNAFFGGNRMRKNGEGLYLFGNNFNVPFFAAINNSAQKIFGYSVGSFGINSLFGSVEIAYNNYLFITGTARKDWFSTLQPGKNSILYPSVGTSFVFTDAISGLPRGLSFGKIRMSWAQVGDASSVGSSDTNLSYSLGLSHLGKPLAYFTSAIGGISPGGNLPNPMLKPFRSEEAEFGLDVRFLENRIGLDATYYHQETTDDIINASVSRASGFATSSLNLGKLTNKGIEVLLTGTPVRGVVTWDISLNFAKNNSKVVSLIAGQDRLADEEPRTRTVRIQHIVGQPFGMITGLVQSKTPDGRLIYDSDGAPVSDPNYYTTLGNGVQKFTGGLNNSVSYKQFTLGALIDFKFDGQVYSGTNVRMTEWGYTKQTLQGRDGEAPLTVTGAIQTYDGAGKPILDGSGNPIYADFSKSLTPGEAQNYWSQLGERAEDKFVYDASFIKLRQVTIGYSVPKRILSKTPFQALTFSLVARNLAILYKKTPNIDPEFSYTSSNAQGLDYFGMPATRTYGFNIRATF